MRSLFLPLLAGLFLAGAARAQPPGPPPGGEGGPSPRLHLFISPMGEPFRSADGKAEWFARADADHDGKITPAEFQADALPLFQKLDRNNDGRIDGFEEQAYERLVVPEITGLYGDHGDLLLRAPPGMGPPGAGPPRGSPRGKPAKNVPQQVRRVGAGRYGLLNVPQPIRGADLEFDGKVTLEEWKKTADIRFGMLDTTRAGVLTVSTLPGAAPPPTKAR